MSETFTVTFSADELAYLTQLLASDEREFKQAIEDEGDTESGAFRKRALTASLLRSRLFTTRPNLSEVA